MSMTTRFITAAPFLAELMFETAISIGGVRLWPGPTQYDALVQITDNESTLRLKPLVATEFRHSFYLLQTGCTK